MAPPSQKGNRWSDKLWRKALSVAVNERDKATGLKKLRLIANKVVDAAASGDIQAAREIGDRLDGKPAQSIDMAVTDERSVIRAPEVAASPADWAATHKPH